MFLYGINGFPGKRVPDVFQKLALIRFFQGGLNYSDLTDRQESGELYEAAAMYMNAWNQAERDQQRRMAAKMRC